MRARLRGRRLDLFFLMRIGITTDMSENQVAHVSFRWSYCEKIGKEIFTHYWLINEWLLYSAKEYIFQLEKGENTGVEHFQGYAHLNHKIRTKSLSKQLNHLFLGIEISAAADVEAVQAYVCKEETRVEGPWSTIVKIKKPLRALVVDKYKPWQLQIHDMIKKSLMIVSLTGCMTLKGALERLCLLRQKQCIMVQPFLQGETPHH